MYVTSFRRIIFIIDTLRLWCAGVPVRHDPDLLKLCLTVSSAAQRYRATYDDGIFPFIEFENINKISFLPSGMLVVVRGGRTRFLAVRRC